ncbi:MAG: PadR family transcriptional regulator [Methanobrevibacter olleyae]|uniref:PadR family transcriptional regulator n=1 Tax=Methanobrevibacter olleyae TaxID=294671 RepID=A0A8T3VL74_METOL|nr:PadR family transcriptional regulator [Methanobrevibacter olleyae]
MADLSESLKWEYINYYKENKVLQYTVNGIYRFLILWIIKHNPKIHGYAIMKEMDNFFDSLINEGSLNKSNPSKIYPILSKMEDEDLIKHSFEINDKKEIKIYEITPKGDFLLEFIREKYIKIKKTPEGNLFFEEFLNQE